MTPHKSSMKQLIPFSKILIKTQPGTTKLVTLNFQFFDNNIAHSYAA